MSDIKYNISLHSNPVIVKSNSVILYRNQSGEQICITHNTINNIVNKNYIIPVNTNDKKVHFDDQVQIIKHDDHSDELVISETESMLLYNHIKDDQKMNIIYDLDINQFTYNVFTLTLFENNLLCNGLYKSDSLSYELVLNHFVGICVYSEIDIEDVYIKNKMFIVYSKKVCDHKMIRLKNKTPYQLTINTNELSYYPIFVICCQSLHAMEDFVKIYPYLVKNIFNYNLK
jgi:hypothetical protein